MEPAEAEILRKHLLSTLRGEDALLLKLVEAIPEDRMEWKPTAEKSKSAADLAWHCAAPARFFLSCFDGKPTPSGKRTATTKAQLLADIREVQAEFTQRVAAMTPAQLAADAPFFGDVQPAVYLLSAHKAHLVHHRGQLSLYLRIMGARVPGIYGPSADDEPAAP